MGVEEYENKGIRNEEKIAPHGRRCVARAGAFSPKRQDNSIFHLSAGVQSGGQTNFLINAFGDFSPKNLSRQTGNDKLFHKVTGLDSHLLIFLLKSEFMNFNNSCSSFFLAASCNNKLQLIS